MDWFNEIIGSGGTIVIVTWLAKELFSGFIRRSDAKKMKDLDFKHYKQQASFDLKYKVYSEIYSKIKKLQGSIEFFLDVNKLYGDYEEALYSDTNKKFFDAGETKPDDFKAVYHSDRSSRAVTNVSHFVGLIGEFHRDLKNFSSTNEFLFSEDESLSIKNILDLTEETKNKINSSYVNTFTYLKINKETVVEELDDLMDGILDEFEERLNNYLQKDINKLNILINETDTLFKKEFDTN